MTMCCTLAPFHVSACGAEMCGVGPPVGDGFRGSRMCLGLFVFGEGQSVFSIAV